MTKCGLVEEIRMQRLWSQKYSQKNPVLYVCTLQTEENVFNALSNYRFDFSLALLPCAQSLPCCSVSLWQRHTPVPNKMLMSLYSSSFVERRGEKGCSYEGPQWSLPGQPSHPLVPSEVSQGRFQLNPLNVGGHFNSSLTSFISGIHSFSEPRWWRSESLNKNSSICVLH